MRIIDTSSLEQNSTLSPNEKSWVYNGLDCCVTLEVRDALLPQLDNVTRNTYEFSKSLQAPVLDMTRRGLLVNQRRRKMVLEKFRGQIDVLDHQLTAIIAEGVGAPVSNEWKNEKGERVLKRWWRSPHKLKNILYDVMELPVQRKRNTEGLMVPSTDRTALEKLSQYYIAEPVTAHLLGLRDLDKKRQFLETEIDPDGRMRTSINIAGTDTGRFASSMSDYGTGTNLQNVDRDLRSVFIADKGYKFINVDLEQGDSRNLGALCWDTFYSEFGSAFAGGYLDLCESGDLHTQVSRMARPDLPWTDDPKANRAIADTIFYRNFSYRDLDKRLGHGSNYLGTPRTMAKHSKVAVQMVEEFQTNYFGAVPCIPQYHKWVQHEIEEYGMLTTLFGRRRFFFDRRNDMATIRKAVAYSPQSMTGEEINHGLLNVWRDRERYGVELLIQVHDSILLQYKDKYPEEEVVPWVIKHLKVLLVLAGDREFFVPAEAKVGWNWGDATPENPDGLIRWKGGDDRRRTELNWTASLT